jgi:hypothetical protein
VIALAGTAHAGVNVIGGHGALALGGSPVNGESDVMVALDAGIAFAVDFTTTKDPLFNVFEFRDGIVADASVITGFGYDPTYLSAELGVATGRDLSGITATLGFVTRLDPGVNFGGGLRTAIDVGKAQVGARVMIVDGEGTELVLLVTIGIGHF